MESRLLRLESELLQDGGGSRRADLGAAADGGRVRTVSRGDGDAEYELGLHRLRGALKNVGCAVGRKTIKRILKEQGIEPAPLRRRQYSWATLS
jgi:hypothetical protein